VLLHDFRGGGGERVDLSLAQILARQEDMLVKRHARVPFTPADRWLIRPNGGAPPAFFGTSGEPLRRAQDRGKRCPYSFAGGMQARRRNRRRPLSAHAARTAASPGTT